MMNLLDARIIFFVLLAVTLVPGQQYTGVKSILPADAKDDGAKVSTAPHGGGTSGPSVISARSIGKFTNDAPAADSKVINLSIKPHQPRDTSGSREARNLGFSADVSLNSIPGGLNNELTNVDLKDPATTPSEVAKDSYGNPVTPFSALGTTGLDSVGFLTDVSKDAPQSAKSDQFGQLNFKVPSYASGIIQPVLLPPSPPAGFADQPPISSTAAPTTSFQFVPNAKIPVINGDDILFAQQPTNGLLPPLFPDEQSTTYKITVGTERSPIFVKDTFGGPSLDQGLALPSEKPPVNFNQGAQTPVLAPQTPQQVPGQIAQVPQQPQFQPTKAPVQKYTGGFGGAPGFLGSQQNIGTAYTSTPQPSKPVPPPTVPTPPQTQFLPTVQPAGTTQSVNKFTGSFGGASGFLGNQQNLGTAYKPTTSTTFNVQKPLQPTSSFPSQTQTPTAINPPSPFQPPLAPQAPHQHQHATQPTKAPGGGFVFGSGNTQRPGQYAGNKFAGSFGGSPGLLGNQKQPGTHVKPDGSILPPSSPGVGFTAPSGPAPTVGSPRPVSSGSTFTGSFGGPPGVLRPYDNVKG